MYYLQDFVYTHPLLAALQVLFMLWMLVDAYRRGAESFWFWVIIIVPLFGALAYFIYVKARDFRGLDLPLFQPRSSMAELRYRAEQIPTLTNHLALAERLIELHDYAMAIPHLEAAQKQEPFHGQVLYFLAVCHTRQGNIDQALPLLETSIQREPRWSNYAAWLLLIEAHDLNKNRQAALDGCRQLVKLSPILQHKCLLAEHLLQDGQNAEAQRLLEGALEDLRFTPGPIRRRNRRWTREARRLLKQATAPQPRV
jgi:hypothetical protein